MSKYEQRDNSGSLFRNEEKKHPNGPDYSGSCRIDGQDYFFDGWLKASESGRKWMSFSFKPKDAPKPAKQPDRAGAVKARKLDDGDYDDIPF